MNTYVKILILIVIGFIAMGVIMVFTASGTYSLTRFNNLNDLFKQHFWKVLVALIMMVVFSKIPYDKYREYSKLLLYIIIVVLVLTFLFAPRVKGAQRWINLGF